MAYRSLFRLGLIGVGSGVVTYNFEELETAGIGALRFGRAAVTVTMIVADYKSTLYNGTITPESENYNSIKSQTHLRAAHKLLDLCCVNGGAFVKVGQHMGSLEYLLPKEYVNTMKVLHSKAPQSPLHQVISVLEEELRCKWDEVFVEFASVPLGAASLAQVHRARLRDGREVAVKVQHPAVKRHSKVDMKGMEVLVQCVSLIFPEFDFVWLVEEMKKNLPLELSFTSEAKNAERVARQFEHLSWLKIPKVEWALTSERVLTMEYCEGGQVNDLSYMLQHGIDTREVSDKISRLYSEMIFVNGYVHCDPHPGNVLVQPGGGRGGGEANIVLLDHGLYVNLSKDFRLTYGNLWLSILDRDLPAIQRHGTQLGVGELYGLFACMVTGRSWESISRGIDKRKISAQEEDELKSDAAKYFPEISAVLSRVPRQMLLIFKTNDLLRGIEFALNTHHNMRCFITMSRCCVRSLFASRRSACGGSRVCRARVALSEAWAHLRISLYSLYLHILHSSWFKYLNNTLTLSHSLTHSL